MADSNGVNKSPADAAKWVYGLVAVGLGLVAIVVSLLIVSDQFETAADVGSVLGIVVAPISTIVAAYFGVQAGAAGKASADKNAKDANDTAIALALETSGDSEVAQEVRRRFTAQAQR